MDKLHKIFFSSRKSKRFQNCDYRTTLFDKPVKNDQGDDCTTGCLLDYPYFKKHFKLNAINLSKQNVLGAGPKANQQINFTRNLDLA